MKLRIPSQSVEYVLADITSPQEIDTQWAVHMAIIPQNQKQPEVGDWEVAEWEGGSVRLLIGPGTSVELGCGHYEVWVRVGATPESAVRQAGLLEVV